VTVQSTATLGQENVLPLPAGTSGAHPGYLIYRVYLPASGDFSGVTPPTITLIQGKAGRTLPVCRTRSPIALPPKARGATAPTDSTPRSTAPPAPGAFCIGTETQRASISRVRGATFLPLATTQTPRLYFLMLRNKLINPSFAYAAQDITQATNPSAASAAMGPYYPRVSTCPLSTLVNGGVAACTPGHRQR